MYFRHIEIPTLDTRPDWKVEARYYNLAVRALHRLGPELRLPVPILKHLDLILQRDAWVVVDRVLNDLPVVAWMFLGATQRHDLYRPVDCELRVYHALAMMATSRALVAMERDLQERLAPGKESRNGRKVVAFRPGGWM